MLMEKEVINLIKVKVIKLRSFIHYITVAIILICLTALFIKIYQNSYRTTPAFSSIKTNNDTKNFIYKIDDSIFKKLFTLSIPMLDVVSEKKPLIDFGSTTGVISRLLTNIDIRNPETYFLMHLPIMSMMETQAVMTPGVELPMQNQDIVEDEHTPAENLPLPENKKTEVEKLEPISDKPLVLIYHTHTTEAYMPSEKYMYKPRDSSYHTDNLNFSVARIGEVVADELNRLGIPTLHNKTVHDVPTYMTSYTNSLKTVEQVLKENPSIKIVVDIHRDAPIKDPQRSREITTVQIDGIIYSRFMIVIGTDKTFPHPNWHQNYQFATMLNNKLEESYPGITRDINLRSERFNQHVLNKAILLEIGSHGNTIEESINSAKVFAKVLAILIEELSMTE